MNCKTCIHLEACSRWTDFPKQCGEPVCRHYQDSNQARADAVNEFILLFEDKIGYHFLSNNSWIGDIIDEIKQEMLGGNLDGRAQDVCQNNSNF